MTKFTKNLLQSPDNNFTSFFVDFYHKNNKKGAPAPTNNGSLAFDSHLEKALYLELRSLNPGSLNHLNATNAAKKDYIETEVLNLSATQTRLEGEKASLLKDHENIKDEILITKGQIELLKKKRWENEKKLEQARTNKELNIKRIVRKAKLQDRMENGIGLNNLKDKAEKQIPKLEDKIKNLEFQIGKKQADLEEDCKEEKACLPKLAEITEKIKNNKKLLSKAKAIKATHVAFKKICTHLSKQKNQQIYSQLDAYVRQLDEGKKLIKEKIEELEKLKENKEKVLSPSPSDQQNIEKEIKLLEAALGSYAGGDKNPKEIVESSAGNKSPDSRGLIDGNEINFHNISSYIQTQASLLRLEEAKEEVSLVTVDNKLIALKKEVIDACNVLAREKVIGPLQQFSKNEKFLTRFKRWANDFVKEKFGYGTLSVQATLFAALPTKKSVLQEMNKARESMKIPR